MVNLQKLLTKVLGMFKVKDVTLTYTSNSYVNSNDFSRIKAKQCGNIVKIFGNFGTTAALPAGQDITIGSISPSGNIAQQMFTGIAGANGHNIAIFIETDGRIHIYNYYGSAPVGWYRFDATLILSGGGV